MTEKKRDTRTSTPATAIGPPGQTPATSTDDASLVVIQHPRRSMMARRFVLGPGRNLRIGRDADCEISLGDEAETVSRKHAVVTFRRAEGAWIRDTESANGTGLNGERVGAGETRLKHGDIIAIGSVRFKFLQDENEELAYHEAVATLVHHDPLTGADNVRRFRDELEREFRRAKRYERPLSLIVLDVDKFKEINDTYGHLPGDTVLVGIVDVCRRCCRRDERIGRLGGDEFAILCPETAGENARRLAERLLKAVGGETFERTDAGESFGVTCSWGVAEVSESMETPEALREAADAALYEAKRGGRGRVE